MVTETQANSTLIVCGSAAVLEPGPSLGPELAIVRRARVLHTLREHGVEMTCNAQIERIEADRVVYTDQDQEQSLHCQQVIIALGAEADASLEERLDGGTARVHRIGDCRDKSFIDGAMWLVLGGALLFDFYFGLGA